MSLWSTMVEALGAFTGKDKKGKTTGDYVPRGSAVQSDLGAVTGGQANRTAIKVGLAVLLGAVVVGLIVAVVFLATNSGGESNPDPSSAHATGTPASPGTGTGSGSNTATATAATTTNASTTTSTTTPTATTTTATTTSTSEGVIP